MAKPPRPLTKRQKKLLTFIVEHIVAFNMPPTFREIRVHMRISSTNGVADHLKLIEKKGYLELLHGCSRGIVMEWDLVADLGLPYPRWHRQDRDTKPDTDTLTAMIPRAHPPE